MLISLCVEWFKSNVISVSYLLKVASLLLTPLNIMIFMSLPIKLSVNLYTLKMFQNQSIVDKLWIIDMILMQSVSFFVFVVNGWS